MSAFVVNKAHIDAMIEAGQTRMGRGPLAWYPAPREVRKLTRDTEDAVGQMLVDACVANVGYRYEDDKLTDLPGPCSAYWILPYHYAPPYKSSTPVEALKLISCYEYQSCEQPDWEKSEAYIFCQALRDDMINSLPGYEEAPWEWTEPEPVGVRG